MREVAVLPSELSPGDDVSETPACSTCGCRHSPDGDLCCDVDMSDGYRHTQSEIAAGDLPLGHI